MKMKIKKYQDMKKWHMKNYNYLNTGGVVLITTGYCYRGLLISLYNN